MATKDDFRATFPILLDLEHSRNSISMSHPIKPYIPCTDVRQLTKTENTKAVRRGFYENSCS